MTTANATAIFHKMVKTAMFIIDKPTIRIGEVDFWFEENILCYSLPVSKWNADKIKIELSAILKKDPVELFIIEQLYARPPIINRDEIETIIRRAWREARLDAIVAPENAKSIEQLLQEFDDEDA